VVLVNGDGLDDDIIAMRSCLNDRKRKLSKKHRKVFLLWLTRSVIAARANRKRTAIPDDVGVDSAEE